MTIVQQPDSAQVPHMVVSALRWSPVDFVLALDQMLDLLRTLGDSDPEPAWSQDSDRDAARREVPAGR